MSWELKKTKDKTKSSYKTLYLSEELISKIDQIAKANDTSFNNVVVSMIESCLKNNSEE